jgi:VIT1/CCC1 family predicted Fe2+/Mn2+ transporter
MHKNKHIHTEPHNFSASAKLNWLRASVLGANDGIVSIAGLVVGVASATNSAQIIFTAGLAGITAGAISMAAGEYVSVSSSRDTEKALLKKERYELENNPEAELEELACIYEEKGLSKQTAMSVARELSAKDAAAAHFDAELKIDPNNLTDPWHAAFASAGSFVIGSIIPITTVLVAPANIRIPFTFFSVLIALGLTGTLSAKIGGADVRRAVVRVIIGGALAMSITYGVGRLFNVSGL